MALKRLGIEHEVIGISEIDKFAIKSYMAIHGKTKNFGDISKIDPTELPDFDFMTYSFPCVDVSVAGLNKGIKKGSNTRSSLLWECEKIIDVKRPKYLLMENVKNLVGKKHKDDFLKWLKILEAYGYSNYWEILNAKDYGVPQNRERVFCVSILNENKKELYKFPEKLELNTRLKDLLEEEVDEKYYMKSEKADQLIYKITKEKKIKDKEVVDSSIKNPKVKQVMNCITARYDAGIHNKQSMGGCVIEPKLKRLGGVFDTDKSRHHTRRGRVQKQSTGTLDTACTWGTLEINKNVEENLIIGSTQKNAAVKTDGISPTLTSAMGTGGGHVPMHNYNYRIRKLTPLECWRLMGVSDEDFYKAQKVNSNTQLYKQAGNAIVVDVLYYIFKNLFDENRNNMADQQIALDI